jgi:hypothetical protein
VLSLGWLVPARWPQIQAVRLCCSSGDCRTRSVAEKAEQVEQRVAGLA